MGLRGYLPEWDAKLQHSIDNETLQKWSELCGYCLKATPEVTTRVEVLKSIYDRIAQ